MARTKMKKVISFDKVMRVVLLDPYVDCWGRLYEKLGVYDWFEERNHRPEVKYIYMTDQFLQYVTEILADKYVVGKRGIMLPKYKRRQTAWDSVCFSPVSIDCTLIKDCMVLDLTGETDKIKTQKYVKHIPTFERGE